MPTMFHTRRRTLVVRVDVRLLSAAATICAAAALTGCADDPVRPVAGRAPAASTADSERASSEATATARDTATSRGRLNPIPQTHPPVDAAETADTTSPPAENADASRARRRESGETAAGEAGGNRVPSSDQFRPSPNILLIVADGLSPEWIGCYGGEGIETPHIDRLAREGLKFHNVYAMSGQVSTQATLLTGQYPNRHGWIGEWDAAHISDGYWCDWTRHFCLTRYRPLQRYAASIAGRWLLNDLRLQPDALLQHGFGRWCVCTESAGQSGGKRGSLWSPYLHVSSPVSRDGRGLPNRDSLQNSWGASGTYAGRFGPDLFTEFVNVRRSGRSQFPFFVYYAMNLPGLPSISPPGASEEGDDTERYRALVRYADQLIGDLLDWLSSSHELDETIVIFTCSGGAPSEVRGRAGGREVPGGRGTLTERGIRVPLIVRYPQVVGADVETDCLVDFTDIAPTICQAAMPRAPQFGDFDGQSFLPVMVGDDPTGPREWIMSLGTCALDDDGGVVCPEKPFVERVLRDRRYKVHVNAQRRIDALWDLQDDRNEARNLVGSSEPEHVRAMEKFARLVEAMPERDAHVPYRPLLQSRSFRAKRENERLRANRGGG